MQSAFTHDQSQLNFRRHLDFCGAAFAVALILQPCCGGPFTSSVLVNGLLGFGLALAVLHLAAARASATAALLLALAVAVGWNAMLTLLHRRR
jgi:hypothetical protein